MNRLTVLAGACLLAALVGSAFGVQTIEVSLAAPNAVEKTATSKDLLLVLPDKFFRARGDGAFSTPYIAELYYTTDGGRTWTSYELFKDLDKPFEFTAQAEGRYGFFVTLLDRKGAYDVMPTEGTAPQVTVLVDWSAPEVSLDSPKGGETVGAAAPLDISWMATDSFLTARPITIDVSLDGGKTWQTAAADIDNTGTHQWPAPAGLNGRVLVRVTAVDEVGHSASAVSASPVLVDTIPPVACVVGPTLAAGESVTLEVRADDADGSGIAEQRLYTSQDNGATWSPAGRAPAGQSFQFKAATGIYGLFVSAADHAGNESPLPRPGDAPQVVIQIDTAMPLVRLKTLSDGGCVSGNTQFPIQWEAVTPRKAERNVSIFLSPDGGNAWTALARDIENSGCFLWNVPPINSSNCVLKVAVKDASGAASEAQSAKSFTIDSTRPTSAIGVSSGALSQPAADLGAVMAPMAAIVEPAAADTVPGEAVAAQTGPSPSAPGEKPDSITGELQTTPAPDAPWTTSPEVYTGVVAPDTTVDGVLKAAFAAYRAGQLAMAREYFKQAAVMAPADARPHAALGKIYAREAGFNYSAKKESFEAALYEFDKALELGGDDADVYNDRGYVLLAAKRNKDAEASFRKATSIGAKSLYWCNLGIALQRLGRRADAEPAFAKALEIDPSMKEANFFMGQLCAGSGRWADAKKFYMLAVDGYGVETNQGRIALAGVQQTREKLGEVQPESNPISVQQKLDRIR